MLVYYNYALLLVGRYGLWMCLEQHFDPEPAYLLGIPPRLGLKPLQTLGHLTLRSYNRLGVGQSHQSFVALGRQQQTLQVTPESVALGAASQKGGAE
jgi:hypothetical protein